MNKIKFRAKNKEKIAKTKEKLRKYRQIAKKYLEIIYKIEKGQINAEDFDFLEINSGILQMQLNYFKLGKGTLDRPYNLGRHENYEFIANFPGLFKNQQDEALTQISGIKSVLSTYNHLIDDLANDNQELKEFVRKNNRRSIQGKKFNLNREKIIEIIFLGIFGLSIPFSIKPDTILIGFIMSLIAVVTIFIMSMITEKN